MWDRLQTRQQIIVMEGGEGKFTTHIVLPLKLNQLSIFFMYSLVLLLPENIFGVHLRKPYKPNVFTTMHLTVSETKKIKSNTTTVY